MQGAWHGWPTCAPRICPFQAFQDTFRASSPKFPQVPPLFRAKMGHHFRKSRRNFTIFQQKVRKMSALYVRPKFPDSRHDKTLSWRVPPYQAFSKASRSPGSTDKYTVFLLWSSYCQGKRVSKKNALSACQSKPQ